MILKKISLENFNQVEIRPAPGMEPALLPKKLIVNQGFAGENPTSPKLSSDLATFFYIR